MTKNMLTDSFYAITYLYKALITVSFRFPFYRLYANKLKSFQTKRISAHIRITESYLGKYLEPRKEPLQRFGTGKTFRHLS